MGDEVTVKASYLSTVNHWNSWINRLNQNKLSDTPVVQTTTTEYFKLAKITVPVSGTVILHYVALYQSTTGNRYNLNLRLMNASGTVLKNGTSYNNLLWEPNVPAGTYYLCSDSAYAKDYLAAAQFNEPAVVSNANWRTLGSTALAIAGTGKASYQKFTMGSRGIVKVRAYRMDKSGKKYGSTVYIQNSSGKTISSSEYCSSSNGYWKVYGLPKGSYRLVLKSTYNNEINFVNISKLYANSSYGTSKRKAKTITKGKYKQAVFVTTDSTSKAHWYKIKVTKTRKAKIYFTNLGSSGTIRYTISGPSSSVRKLKKNNISKVTTRYSGTLKKGTYYIKCYRNVKSWTGAYKVTYK